MKFFVRAVFCVVALVEGMRFVFVNDRAAIADGKFLDVRTGHVLSRRD